MKRIQKNLVIEEFRENTSIHGVYYLNTKNRTIKVTWGMIVFISTLLILISTILLVQKYLDYNDHIITKEYDLDKIEEIPNILACSSEQLLMVDSIAKLNVSLNNSFPINGINSYLTTVYEKRGFIDLDYCAITIRSNVLDCMHFKRELIFTFNGICLFIHLQELKQNESLLFKQFDQFAYFKTYKPHIKLKFKSNDDRLYFKLLSSSSSTRYALENHVILNDSNSYAKHYDMVLQQDSFSSSLVNEKCFQSMKKYLNSRASYDEYSCEIECLQHLVKQTLNCHFSFNLEKSPGVPYCTVGQLLDIEEIVKNYTYSMKAGFKVCKNCLPNCETFKFILNEVDISDTENEVETPGLTLNLYISFSKITTTRILNLEQAELLNLVNGLWSLFLGISVLSIWEIFEFIFSLKHKNVAFKKNNFMQNFENSRIFQKIKSCLFVDSYFHGFNFIFMVKSSQGFKLRWIVVIIFATIG